MCTYLLIHHFERSWHAFCPLHERWYLKGSKHAILKSVGSSRLQGAMATFQLASVSVD